MWIRKVKQERTAFRVSVPLNLVKELEWTDCKYVTVEIGANKSLIIRRMLGDGGKQLIGSNGPDGSD